MFKQRLTQSYHLAPLRNRKIPAVQLRSLEVVPRRARTLLRREDFGELSRAAASGRPSSGARTYQIQKLLSSVAQFHTIPVTDEMVFGQVLLRVW